MSDDSPPQLRPATEADVDAIAAVWHGGWRDGHLGHVPDELAQHRTFEVFRWLMEQRIFQTTVAVDEGEIVGFVVVDADEVEQVYVAATHRGSGVAAALLAQGEAEVAPHFDVAWLAVVAGNGRARRFYERSGWHDAGPFTYDAVVPGGTVGVPSHRYEKLVRPLPG